MSLLFCPMGSVGAYRGTIRRSDMPYAATLGPERPFRQCPVRFRDHDTDIRVGNQNTRTVRDPPFDRQCQGETQPPRLPFLFGRGLVRQRLRAIRGLDVKPCCASFRILPDREFDAASDSFFRVQRMETARREYRIQFRNFPRGIQQEPCAGIGRESDDRICEHTTKKTINEFIPHPIPLFYPAGTPFPGAWRCISHPSGIGRGCYWQYYRRRIRGAQTAQSRPPENGHETFDGLSDPTGNIFFRNGESAVVQIETSALVQRIVNTVPYQADALRCFSSRCPGLAGGFLFAALATSDRSLPFRSTQLLPRSIGRS
jgi:hypothetical protein